MILDKNFEAFRGVVNSIAFKFREELVIRESRITATGKLQEFSRSSKIDDTRTMWTVESSNNSGARICAFLIDDQKTKIIFQDGTGWIGQKAAPIGKAFDDLIEILKTECSVSSEPIEQLKQQVEELEDSNKMLNVELSVRNTKIKGLNVLKKIGKNTDEFQKIVNETRMRNGKPNYSKIGRKLGIHHSTAKGYVEKLRLR